MHHFVLRNLSLPLGDEFDAVNTLTGYEVINTACQLRGVPLLSRLPCLQNKFASKRICPSQDLRDLMLVPTQNLREVRPGLLTLKGLFVFNV